MFLYQTVPEDGLYTYLTLIEMPVVSEKTIYLIVMNRWLILVCFVYSLRLNSYWHRNLFMSYVYLIVLNEEGAQVQVLHPNHKNKEAQ